MGISRLFFLCTSLYLCLFRFDLELDGRVMEWVLASLFIRAWAPSCGHTFEIKKMYSVFLLKSTNRTVHLVSCWKLERGVIKVKLFFLSCMSFGLWTARYGSQSQLCLACCLRADHLPFPFHFNYSHIKKVNMGHPSQSQQWRRLIFLVSPVAKERVQTEGLRDPMAWKNIKLVFLEKCY